MKIKMLVLVAAFGIAVPASALTHNWSFVPAADSSGSFAPVRGTVSGLVEGSNSGVVVQAFVTASPFAGALGGSYDFQSVLGAGPAFIVTGGIVTHADAVFVHDGVRLYLASTAGMGEAGLATRLDGPAGIDFAIAGTPAYFTPLAAGSIPEPGSWALLIAGFGLTGAALRHRSGLYTRG